jgi:type I restriction enzyme, S subunit
MEVKAGYKQTEVGVIPEDWQLRPLLTVVRVASGQVDPKKEPFRSMILVAPDHIESGSGRLLKKETARDQRAISGKYLFEKGDILYSKIRPYLRKVILADFGGLCSADMYPLKPDSGISAGFVFALILGHRFTKYAESVSVRSGMPKVNRAELAEYTIALPPKKVEQRAIAATLSDVDALLAKLDQLIAKKRDIKQAAMQQLLTGKQRLPGFSEEWKVKRLGEVLKVRHGKSQHDVAINDGAYPILATGGEIGRTNHWLYDKPSVLIGRKGTIDMPQYVEEPFWTIDTLFFTEISSAAAPKFVFYKFNMINWRSYNEASGVPSLNASTIEDIEFNCPDFPEQTAIATILSDMDAEIATLEARREKTRALKQGMMQELLTGRIRLNHDSLD